MSQTFFPDTSHAEFSTVTNVAQNISTTLVAGKKYQYSCDIASWVCQGSNPTATAGAGSMYVPAGYVLPVHGTRGAKLSVLRAGGASGNATLAPGDLL